MIVYYSISYSFFYENINILCKYLGIYEQPLYYTADSADELVSNVLSYNHRHV